MTKEELAATLNGRQYREEITKAEEAAAKAAGLVVIYGASDDLMEIVGAEDDELGADGEVCFTRTGLLRNDCSSDTCPHFTKLQENAATVEPLWDSEGYSWTYKTTIPHATFDVMEDEDKYCRGIVFALSDVPA